MRKCKLKNLDCASCAVKIEEELKKQKDVRYASVNFSTSELVVDTDDIEKVVEVVKKVEPEVEVIGVEFDEGSKVEKHTFKKETILIVISAILFVVGVVLQSFTHLTLIKYAAFLSAYLIVGYKIIWYAIKSLTRGIVFNENLLLTIATIGAIAIHEMPEAVGVMLFFRVGQLFQDFAVGKSRMSIKALLEIKPTFANLKVNGEIVR